MAAGSSKGRASRAASRREPAAVTQRSMLPSSEPSRPPDSVFSISRLARVAGSMAMTSASPARFGGDRAGSLPAWVISRCAAIRPSAEISAPASPPKPSRVSTPYRRFSRASEAEGSARAWATGCTSPPTPASARLTASSANSRSGTRISEGCRAARAAARPDGAISRLSTSPVDSSTVATAAWPPRRAIAASRLAPRASSRPSSVRVPGVTMRTTSRATIDLDPRFLASAGLSICSQTATLKPARISLAR